MKRSLDDLQRDYYMWRSGWRHFLTTILPFFASIAAVLLTIHFAYLAPQRREEKKERFDKLVGNLNSTYSLVRTRAIRILSSEYDQDGCEALRDIALPKAFRMKDRELIEIIRKELPEDLCLGDIGEAQRYIEILVAMHFPKYPIITVEESWIYVGNYNFRDNVWVSQKDVYGYDTTLSDIKSFKPSDLMGKELSVAVSMLNAREGIPYKQNERMVFPEQKDTLKRGDKLIVKEIKDIQHPLAEHVIRIWEKIY